jgi:hypothetical protein
MVALLPQLVGNKPVAEWANLVISTMVNAPSCRGLWFESVPALIFFLSIWPTTQCQVTACNHRLASRIRVSPASSCASSPSLALQFS